jgi:hypothetical protein
MKLNIDTDAARTAHVSALNDKANAFVMELEDRLDGMTTTEQSSLLDRLAAVVSDKDSTAAFTAGIYAQQSNGQPAAQLGAGSSSANPEDDALQVIMASTRVPQGVKAAIVRVITPSDPAFIDVESDGTPKAFRAAERERDAVKTERDEARQELQDERDPNKSGSLAKQLAAAQAAATAGGLDPTKVDAVKTALTTAEIEFGKRKSRAMGPGFVISDDQAQAVTDSLAQMRQIVGS